MRIFGHPIHPLLIHFPTALLPMDFVLSSLYLITGNVSFYNAGAYCLWAGTTAGLLAMFTGLIDLAGIPRSNKAALALAIYHGAVNGLIILIFAIIAYKSWQVFPLISMASFAGVTVKGFLVFALFIGNFLGGKLIYTHHIGLTFNKTKE
jgi:uncharacterized membrane protein